MRMEEYIIASDKGICDFCGQPIMRYERAEFIRLEDDFEEEEEPRIVHMDCLYEE